VHPNLVPNVTISANINSVICYGTPMIYTTSISNGGATPHYQWMINGINTGNDTSVFSSSTIDSGDVISVILTSNALCVLPPQDTSNLITTLVDPVLTPAVSISANPPGQFCDGAVITYTASSFNEGLTPVYQWQVNGSNVSTNSNTYIIDQLQNNDTLQCILTSSVHCPFVNPVSSNLIIIDRLPPLVPIVDGTDELCFGKDAFLSVTVIGGNNGPYYYSWDNNLGNDTSYNFTAISTITYIVTVSDSCSTPRTATHTIKVDPLPIPEFAIKPENATILNPFFDFINQSSNAVAWAWNFGDTTFSSEQQGHHTYLNAGHYDVQLIATSTDGCVDSITHSLEVEEVTTIYFPNSFTPNGDGKNDFFEPAGHAMTDFEMTVWNRWGEKVFYTNSALNPWEGEMQSSNEKAPEGVYVFVAKFKGDLKKNVFEGQVILIR
jgi:gliding motility-associated-like protein